MYIILLVISFVVVWEIEVYFTQLYFVSGDSKIKTWYDADENYFSQGGEETTIYVQLFDEDDLLEDAVYTDFSSLET